MLGILVTTYDPKHLLNQNKWLEGIDSEVNKIVFVTNYENLEKVGEIGDKLNFETYHIDEKKDINCR